MGLVEKYKDQPATLVHADLAEVFKTLRKSRGYTQAEVAEICEVSRITVVSWEKGIAKIPAYAFFMMLAKTDKYSGVVL